MIINLIVAYFYRAIDTWFPAKSESLFTTGWAYILDDSEK